MTRGRIVPLKGPRTQTPQLERQYAATSPDRFLRELVQNAKEADATQILIEPWLNAEAHTWGVKVFVADNGVGMDPDELVEFMGTYAHSGKRIGIREDNFGVGSRATCLPWNPYGMVVISWKEADDDGTLVWLAREGTEYGLVWARTEDGSKSEKLTVENEWLDLRRRFDWDSGTIVVLLGKDEKDDSWFGPNAVLKSVDPVRSALNLRYLETPKDVEIKATDPSTTSVEVMRDHLSGRKHHSVWQPRRVRGLLHELSQGGRKIQSRGEVVIDRRTLIEWILWRPSKSRRESPYDRHYALVVRDDEIYSSYHHHQTWRAFGLGEIRDRLTLIIHPMDAYPDQTRERLVLKGNEGEDLPILEWGALFYQKMPEEIRLAILEARREDRALGKLPKHIADRIKAACRRMFQRRNEGAEYDESKEGARGPGSSFGEAPGDGAGSGSGSGGGSGGAPGSGRRVPGGLGTRGTRKRTQRDGIVNPRWDARQFKDDMEKLAAFYTPIDSTLVLNPGHSLIEDEVKHYQERHPDRDPAEVAKLVKLVYGTSMAARVTHAESWLSRDYTAKELEQGFLTPKALTTAMFGLYGLEHEIDHTIRHSAAKAIPV